MGVNPKPAIHWHSLLFWGSFAVAASCLITAPMNKDGKPHWAFDEYGRTELKKFVRYNFPKTADWMGLGYVQNPVRFVVPQPKAVGVHAH